MMSIKDNSMYYPKERPVASLKGKTYNLLTQDPDPLVHSIPYTIRQPY